MLRRGLHGFWKCSWSFLLSMPCGDSPEEFSTGENPHNCLFRQTVPSCSSLLPLAPLRSRSASFFRPEKQIFHLRLGNYGEYVAFFGAGVVAYRHQWLNKITDAIGRQWTIITAAAVCAYTFFVVFAWSFKYEPLPFSGVAYP